VRTRRFFCSAPCGQSRSTSGRRSPTQHSRHETKLHSPPHRKPLKERSQSADYRSHGPLPLSGLDCSCKQIQRQSTYNSRHHAHPQITRSLRTSYRRRLILLTQHQSVSSGEVSPHAARRSCRFCVIKKRIMDLRLSSSCRTVMDRSIDRQHTGSYRRALREDPAAAPPDPSPPANTSSYLAHHDGRDLNIRLHRLKSKRGLRKRHSPASPPTRPLICGGTSAFAETQ